MAEVGFNVDTGMPEQVTLACGCWIEAEFNLPRLHYMLWLRQEGGQCLGGDRFRIGATVDPATAEQRPTRLSAAVLILEEADRRLHELEGA